MLRVIKFSRIATALVGAIVLAMGIALGSAIVFAVPAKFAVFIGLAVGLGVPFLLHNFVPPLRHRLTKPDSW